MEGRRGGGGQIGEVTQERAFAMGKASVPMDELEALYENRLEKVFPVQARREHARPETYSYKADAHSRANYKSPARAC